MSTESRYFKVCKLNNMKVEIGRAKIPKESSNMLSASKKLFKTICREKNVLKNKKFYESTFHIQETTKGSKKKVYGPYKGTCKVGSDGKKCIFNVVKLRSSKKIKKGGGDNNSNNKKLLEMIRNEELNVEELIHEINSCKNVDIVDKEDKMEQTPLIIECGKREPNIKIIEALLNKGANVNRKCLYSKKYCNDFLRLDTDGVYFKVTPLMKLLENYTYEKEDVLLFLLKNGADINYINNYYFTPLTYYLHHLYRYPYKEIIYETVKLLLENGASDTINVDNTIYYTALSYAVYMGNYRSSNSQENGIKNLIKLLFKYGATQSYGNQRTEDEKKRGNRIKKFSVLNLSYIKEMKKFIIAQRPTAQRPTFLSTISSIFSGFGSKSKQGIK
jgi:ankyrin repeat protein